MTGTMSRAGAPRDDFRRLLREKALCHSLFYLKLGATGKAAGETPHGGKEGTLKQKCEGRGAKSGTVDVSAARRATATVRVARQAAPRINQLLRNFEPRPAQMQYLRPPRVSSPPEDITSSDDDDRAAVRRRSRDLSDDSAVELEPRPRRHSHPKEVGTPKEAISPRRELTLIEANVVEIGRRSSEGCDVRSRCVRTPSVVVSDYSDGAAAGATPEEVEWLRSLSADSACSSCSTLSSREDDEFDSPPVVKKINPAKFGAANS